MIKTLLSFLLYAVIALAAQNAVFTRAFGVSRLLRLVDSGELALTKFSLMLAAMQLLVAPLAFFANRIMAGVALRNALRPLVFVLCTAVAYFVILLLVGLVGYRIQAKNAKDYLAVLPGAAFNCCVIGTLLLTATGGYTLLQTMAFGLGSAVGYAIALLIVSEGQRKIQNRNVPSTFRGLPVTLIYIGVIALAIYGFTGHTLSM